MAITSGQEQHASQTSTFWQEQMGKHPTLYAVLGIIAAVGDFFFNGHFIKVTGRWVIRVGGYVAETVLMFAVLWITCSSVAPKLVELFMSEQLMQYLVWLSLAMLALIPEIILASAVVNVVGHWLAVVRNRQNMGAWIWAILFTVPTILFFILTAITLNTLGANGGNLVQASTDTLNLRLDAGWIYGLLELTYAGVKRYMLASTTLAQPVPVPPAPPTPDEVAQQLIPLLVPHLEAMRTSILAQVQQSVPTPQINHHELAHSLVPLLPIPEVDPVAIARAVAPLLRPAFVEVRHTIIEEVKAIVPHMAAQPTVPQIKASTPTSANTNDDNDLDRDMRLERTYQALLQEGKKPSANVLYVLANCNRKAAQRWLKSRQSGTDDIDSGTDTAGMVPPHAQANGTEQEERSHYDTAADLEVVLVGGTDDAD